MSTFDYLWQLLDPAGTYTVQKESCKRIWNTLPLQRQRIIYATIRAKQQKGEKVHPNPKFALEDNLNAQPDFLDGYEIDEAWEQNVPLVQVHFNGLYKICRLADAQAFGLTIARPFDQMAG